MQEETTSTEFVEWQTFLDMEVNDFDRTCVYLAQIAAEIRRGNHKNPQSVEIDHFLLKFEDKAKKVDDPDEQEKRKRRALDAANVWIGTVTASKIDPKDIPKPRVS